MHTVSLSREDHARNSAWMHGSCLQKKKKERKIIPSLVLHFQVPEGLVFSEYLVGASRRCAPSSQVQLVSSSPGI